MGISGEDGGLLRARQRLATVDGESVDVGLVGDVVEVDLPTGADGAVVALRD